MWPKHKSRREDARDGGGDAPTPDLNFVVPTEDGFKHMERVNKKSLEIYRVTAKGQDVGGSPDSAGRPVQLQHSVEYMKVTLPCVLRSQAPFVPTQLLIRALVPQCDAAEVHRALKECNIFSSYMNPSEYKALREQPACADISSRELTPLGKFHKKRAAIARILRCTIATDDDQQ